MKTNDKPEIKLFLLDKTDHRMYLSKIPVTEDYYWTSSPNSPYYTMPMVVWPRNEVYGENKSQKVLDKEDSDAKWACGVRPAMMIDRQLLEALYNRKKEKTGIYTLTSCIKPFSDTL